MDLKSRLRKVEQGYLLKKDLFYVPDFENWSDEALTRWYDDYVIEIKNKFGLTKDVEVREYFDAMSRHYEMCKKGNGEEADHLFAKYEADLMKAKWEKQTGEKWKSVLSN
ncbi:MAG: hypothetical protein IH949_01370 [Bacteroidetes bacterium]|nr:hypothetical protein [Bacteroidota bacterium]